MKTYRNFVNGKYVDAADGRTIPVINPSTEEQYATAPLSASADVDQAMQVAADAFETWRDSTPKDRSLALFRIADAIEARADEFVNLESENCGKPKSLTASSDLIKNINNLIPRGFGRSYGDSANSKKILQSNYLNRFISFDHEMAF